MASSSREDYIYEPLASPRTIRLVSLARLPSAPSERLCIDLYSAGLDELPPWNSYTALSYVWGDDSAIEEVTCNGKTIRITKNLHQALEKVWQITPDQVLWADAICIDQADNAEKSAQVQIMGDIYRKAHAVLIWLGESSDGGEPASSTRILSRKDQAQHFMHGLLSSTWIRRMWTLQEIVLASKAIVMYDRQWIEWRELSGAVMSTQWKSDNSRAVQSEVQFIERNRLQMAVSPKALKEGSKRPASADIGLVDIILETRARECHDSRDKIYALLTILSTQSYFFSPVDYSQPVWMVFAHATALTLMFDHRMSLLSISGRLNAEPLDRRWPTWVPDLTATKLLDTAKAHEAQSFLKVIAAPKPEVDNWFDWDRRRPEVLKMRAWLIGVVLKGSEAEPRRMRLVHADYAFGDVIPDRLAAFPTCTQLSQRLQPSLTDAKEVRVNPSKQAKTVFAEDVRAELANHVSGNCTCPVEPHTHSSNLTVISSLYEKLTHKLEAWDWICEVPLNGGLCVLRPTPSGPFQLVGTMPSLGSLGRSLKTSLADGMTISRRRSARARRPGTEQDLDWMRPAPTAITSFEVI